LFFILTYGLALYVIASGTLNLNILNHEIAGYVYIISFWVGFAFASGSSYTFAKQVSNLSIRGLFICALLVPITIYTEFLDWAVFNNEGSNNFVTSVAYIGSFFASVVAGVAIGLLFSF
jgi:hypothetical protein